MRLLRLLPLLLLPFLATAQQLSRDTTRAGVTDAVSKIARMANGQTYIVPKAGPIATLTPGYLRWQVRALSGTNTPSALRFVHPTMGGLFNLDPADTTTPDDGALTLVTASGRRYKREVFGDNNLLWWGIVPGTGDHTAALQAAASGVAKGTLYVPDGVYTTTNHVIVAPSLTVKLSAGAIVQPGAGFAPSTVLGNDGTYIFILGSGASLTGGTIDLKNTGVGGVSVIQASGVTVRGCAVKNMVNHGVRFGIALVGGDHHHVENNLITDLAHGINVFRSDYSTVTGNVTNRTFSGIYTVASNHCFIANNTSENCEDVGIDVERSQHTYVIGNHAAFCNVAEFALYDGGAENTDQPLQLDVVFSGNTARRGPSYIISNPTGTTPGTAPCDNSKAAYSIISITPGATGIVFQNNLAHVEFGYGFYHPQLSGPKTGRTVFFRGNTVYSSAGFISTLESEGLTVDNNTFVGLTGSEQTSNIIREAHGLIMTGNTFRYVNPKISGYAINLYFQTGYATAAPYVARNTFINTGTLAFQVDHFQNPGLGSVLDNNAFSTGYNANGGLNITANGDAVLRNQNLKIMLFTGDNNIGSSVPGLFRSGASKAFGNLAYGRNGYNGLACTLAFISAGGTYLTSRNTLGGLTASASGGTITLNNSTGTTTNAYMDLVVNSYTP